MNKKQKGFTLVELMIVVAIIGILAAVAIPKFADMLEKSREGATKGYVSAMKSAVANYLADNQGQVPYTLDTSTWTDVSTGTIYPPYVAGNTENSAALMSSYMDNIPNVKATSKSKANADAGKGPGQGPFSATVYYAWHPVVAGSQAFHTSAQAPSVRVAAPQAGKGWRYDRTSGSIWVNSQELDMAGRSYTMFGFD